MSIGAYIAAGYFATSLFLFCFPQLLRKRKTYNNQLLQQAVLGKRILKICHRGAPRYTTQNTIQGFRKVLTQTDMLEMDVCQTKDNVLVVHHDKNLLRTCGVNKNVDQLMLNQLPNFKDQIELDFSINGTIASNNQKIPTLQKVFQIFQGIPMDIELKTPTQTSIKQITRLIGEYDRKDITFVGIRNQWQDRLKELNPQLQYFYNDKAVAKLMLLYFTGLLPFVNIKESSLQIPLYTTEFHEWKRLSLPDQRSKVDTFFKLVKFSNFIAKPLIWHLRKRGIITMFWVCNEQEHYQRAIQLGAQGIMTDDPYLLSNFIKKRQQKKTI